MSVGVGLGVGVGEKTIAGIGVGVLVTTIILCPGSITEVSEVGMSVVVGAGKGVKFLATVCRGVSLVGVFAGRGVVFSLIASTTAVGVVACVCPTGAVSSG